MTLNGGADSAELKHDPIRDQAPLRQPQVAVDHAEGQRQAEAKSRDGRSHEGYSAGLDPIMMRRRFVMIPNNGRHSPAVKASSPEVGNAG